jgi:hypothetical protein
MSMVSIAAHFMEGGHDVFRMAESFGFIAGVRSRSPVSMPSSFYAKASHQPDRFEHPILQPTYSPSLFLGL